MIYVANVKFMIPTEGTEQLLNAIRNAICEGCPAGIGAGNPAAAPPFLSAVSLMLNTNAPTVDAGLAFADLVVTDDSGGAPVVVNQEAAPTYCIAGVEGPEEGGDGFWRIVFDQQIWTSAGDGTTPPVITGLALVNSGAELLIGYAELPDGPANFETNDIVKLSAELLLKPQLPPV